MHHLSYPSAWLPLVAGLALLVGGARAGNGPLLVVLLPAALLIAGGLRSLLFTDLRASQLTAIGSVAAFVLALPLGFVTDVGGGLAAAALAVLSFLACGWLQIALRPELEGVPNPRAGPIYAARVALDQAVLGVMAVLTPVSDRSALAQAVEECATATEALQQGGFLADPESYHRQPPALITLQCTEQTVARRRCELTRWASDFEPPPGIPAHERLYAHEANRTAQALLLRHERPAPWLVCVHGFGMGDPVKDFGTFRAAELHDMGLNIALFTLPLHGARAPGRVSGEGFFGLSPMDFVHAESQAIWDLRRLLGWLRAQGASRVGVYGISLGAYTSAVLASIEPGLECVIAGIPPTDMVDHAEYLGSPVERRAAAIAGLETQQLRTIHSVVAPLELRPLVPKESRFLYAATGDQFVPVEQVHALWRHWQQPCISWCRGGHMSALMQSAPRDLVRDALRATLLREED